VKEEISVDRPVRTEIGIQVPAARKAPPSMEPDITVVVPSYGHEAYIELALQSVLAQTHTSFRLLVVDDRSPDRTVERARCVRDPRIAIHVNETRLGLGDSLLNALSTIATPYVAVLNSDDLFHPERLERCIAVLKESPDVQVVATGLITIDAEGCRITPANVRPRFDGIDITNWIEWFARAGQMDTGRDQLAELLERNFLITSSNIVCRTDFLRSRRDQVRGLEYCLDWQVFLAAAADRALACLPDELVGYRLHPTNTVWFDTERKAAYTTEVNRVLGGTLDRLLHSSSPHPAAGSLRRILGLLVFHAAKHSDARDIVGHGMRLIRLATGGVGATTATGRRSRGL